MRRPVSHLAAICASLALAVPPVTLPLHAQERLNREQAIQLCVEKTGSRDRQTVGACVVEEFEARGQQGAADEARRILEQEAADAAAAEEAAPPMDRDRAIQICRERLESDDRQTVGACVADELEAAGQVEQAQRVREVLAEERRQAARAAQEAREAEERRQAEEARAAEDRRQAEQRAAEEARAAEERRQAEQRAAEAEAEAARRAAEEASRLTRDEAIRICVDRLNTRDRQIVGACVADEFEAAGQTRQAERVRTVLAEEAAAAEAAAARAAQAQAEAETPPDPDRMPLTREAALEACRAELGQVRRTTLRACIADKLEEDGQIAVAERIRANLPESRIADEVAQRGEPELTEAERQAAERAAGALDGQAATAAAAGGASTEVVEETVALGEVRSSADDFDTTAVVTDDDDGGLSRSQKLALGALGALAVGTLLSNRNRVVSNSGDRVVVQRDDGDLQVLKDDDALLRQPGSNVRTENFEDGSTRTTFTREDGSKVVTIRDASLRVLRRTLIEPNGEEFVLIDDTREVAPVDVSQLPDQPVVARAGSALDPLAGLGVAPSDDPLRDALMREAGLTSPAVDRRFSLAQVRNIPEVRALAPAFEVADVTFASGSAAIAPEQARNLTDLARLVLEAIRENPREVFLIEGHTDAVGDAAYNLALSDRRAESLALALNEYFGVPVENMVVQGYGEQFLKVQTLGDERANRRATVRQITGLLRTAAAN
ncbi:OmpA family protein [Jannaschia seohaensis]|uniref:Outer membrane protein OmpA n=1 Tax=Jannaschia seohaensis TaxID=475081 RepID=A0A2Y9C0P9_9RHOB|nr:OmpA family protein [Jannaschia seohaensis]PWJ18097.1 outer membrane protein OmpA-like peptidoglycan-associated protein [Jannaschia seohaensis]SSA46622.1 Outer membrane protein OmpA [Jannaschia seohaensis]